MTYHGEIGLSLLPTHPFYIFKQFLEKNPSIVSEIETAMNAVISRVDPSDRGNRFVTGAAFEWILAAACGLSGIATLPGGHSEDGFDLLSLRNSMRGLWSIKSSASETLGDFRLSNTMNSKGSAFTTPTVFVHPKLPGLVYLDPIAAPIVASKVKVLADATTLSGKLISEYATNNPKLVIYLKAPINTKSGKGDPYLDFVVTILTSGTYPNLGPLIADMRENARTIKVLKEQFEKGVITEIQYQQMLNDLLDTN